MQTDTSTKNGHAMSGRRKGRTHEQHGGPCFSLRVTRVKHSTRDADERTIPTDRPHANSSR